MSIHFKLPLRVIEPDQVTTDPPCRCRDPFQERRGVEPERLLDVRTLGMDAQIGRTLAVAEELNPGERLRQVSESIVWPLFSMLGIRGFRYQIIKSEENEAQVLIWKHL